MNIMDMRSAICQMDKDDGPICAYRPLDVTGKILPEKLDLLARLKEI